MSISSAKIGAARRASKMTFEQITKAAGLKSTSTYVAHEENPDQFRLSEVAGIYKSMDEISRPIFKDAICEIFLDE